MDTEPAFESPISNETHNVNTEAVPIVYNVRRSADVIDRRGEAMSLISVETPDLQRQAKLAALAAHGIVDYGSLMTFGCRNFFREKFESFGTGRRFARLILESELDEGEKIVSISRPILRRIAKALGLPTLNEERRALFLSELEKQGVTDRGSLLALGSEVFNRGKIKFGVFGVGRDFYHSLFGEIVQPHFKVEHLNQIADMLGYPKISLRDYRKALSGYGIVDKFTMVNVGVHAFSGTEFKPFGFGAKFAGKVLGIAFDRNSNLCLPHLYSIAKKLRLPDYAEKTMNKFCDILFQNEIYDQETLEEISLNKFKQLDFGEYGGGHGFVSAVLGIGFLQLERGMLSELGRRMRLPKNANGKRPKIRHYDVRIDFLELNGYSKGDVELKSFDFLVGVCHVYDLEDLVEKGCDWFEKKIFKTIGDDEVVIRGIHIASTILGRPIFRITELILIEIGEALGFKREAETLSLNADDWK